MQSVREQIIRAVMQTLEPVAQQYGAVFVRRPIDGFSENDGEGCALAVFAESDEPASEKAQINNRSARTLVVRIVPQVFDADDPDRIADAILVDAHKMLFANRNLYGLALTLRQGDCTWASESGIVPVGQIPAAYEIDYRVQEADIAQRG
jgi:hypothetical protein